MDIRILGMYDFDNFTLLNALMSEEERSKTAIHEYTHFQLSNQSVYGIIQYCLKKLDISISCNNDANKQKAAMKFFADNTKKVQEGLAVFIEATYFMLNSVKDYEEFIEKLKINNECYYRYVQPLCFILEYMKDVENNDKLTITNAVFQIALKSMNTCIYDYDGNVFARSKSIKKLVSNPDFSKEYLPNKLFFSMIEECSEQETFEDFIQKLYALAQNNTNVNLEFYQERLVKIKKFILEIFEGSQFIDVYKNRLNQVNIQKIDASYAFLQQLPTAFNEDYVQRNMKRIRYESLKEKCRTKDCSVLFLLGGLKKNILELLEKKGIVNTEIKCESRELLLFYSLVDKEIYGCVLEKRELQELLNQKDNKCVLLVSYKNYDYDNYKILDYSTIADKVYIYCDRTYSNALTYFELWKDRKVFYRYMVYESMVVLLIKISENSLFLLPMTPLVAEEAEKDIIYNHDNMHAITEVEDGEYDSYIVKDEKIRNEIDTIINCLFFINLSASTEE